ncbi:hypothetical protein C7974DRAFT_444359 [Boeremia exigua]|uniref:uncharacterized protein n=1 Tax=Boeremia exigua TaxID=749465 RepID=UPI001E8E3390|nr:uncharacterized protein C7974DRAFT_444359 [Boeremia exigua]KAH6614334.1 hypothetical protein C7974DRAFT_444359 [Boeremia exigua]
MLQQTSTLVIVAQDAEFDNNATNCARRGRRLIPELHTARVSLALDIEVGLLPGPETERVGEGRSARWMQMLCAKAISELINKGRSRPGVFSRFRSLQVILHTVNAWWRQFPVVEWALIAQRWASRLPRRAQHLSAMSRVILLPRRRLSSTNQSRATAGPNTNVMTAENQKYFILLLSLHSILLMAVKDMIDMAVTMLRPHQRDATREHTENSMPILERAVADFKAYAFSVRISMLARGGGAAFARAQDAINVLATPYFRPDFTWGVDQISLETTRADITSFYNTGYHELVYVLQTRLLQAGVPPTTDEVTRLLLCSHYFMQELDQLIALGHLSSIPSTVNWRQCQMFAPRELVCVPAVAHDILNDRRPDFLGRLNFHILSDAGFHLTWEDASKGASATSVYFHSDNLSHSAQWPIQATDRMDILGRTALHIAVRQGTISSVIKLSRAGANMHQRCLNGLSLLHIAACHGHETVVRYLIYQMDYHECEQQCYTLAGQCQEQNLRYLHRLDDLDGLRRTPFWHAACGSHFEVMTLLTKSIRLKVSPKQFVTVKVNTEHADSHGHNALAIAARDGRVDVLKFLFKLRSTTWDPLLEELMPYEHLLLAYAVQSKNRDCIKLVIAQRRWSSSGRVFARAMEYANQNPDSLLLRDALLGIYTADEAVLTANPFASLTHRMPSYIRDQLPNQLSSF